MYLEMEKGLLDEIIQSSLGVGYETGGFIGIRHNRICEWVFDEGVKTAQKGIYCPNRDKFYFVIETWKKKGMTDFGIVHTHLNGNSKLSQGDIQYINSVFDSNRDLGNMFFPIVIPDKNICVYRSYRKDGKILIHLVPLKII